MRSKLDTRYLVTRLAQEDTVPLRCPALPTVGGCPLIDVEWQLLAVNSEDITSLSWLAQLFRALWYQTISPWNHHCLHPAQNLSFPIMQQQRGNTPPSPHRWVLAYTFPTYRRILEGIRKCLKTKMYWKGDLILNLYPLWPCFVLNSLLNLTGINRYFHK